MSRTGSQGLCLLRRNKLLAYVLELSLMASLSPHLSPKLLGSFTSPQPMWMHTHTHASSHSKRHTLAYNSPYMYILSPMRKMDGSFY